MYQLFQTRYTLFKTVYTHRAGKAVEYMIRDALLEADRAWGGKISAAIDRPQDFIRLDARQDFAEAFSRIGS